MNENSESNSPSWFEKPANVNRLIIGLVVACLALLAVEAIFGGSFYDDHHPAHFPKVENVFGYQALLGLFENSRRCARPWRPRAWGR